jgi:hypothetical protein
VRRWNESSNNGEVSVLKRSDRHDLVEAVAETLVQAREVTVILHNRERGGPDASNGCIVRAEGGECEGQRRACVLVWTATMIDNRSGRPVRGTALAGGSVGIVTCAMQVPSQLGSEVFIGTAMGRTRVPHFRVRKCAGNMSIETHRDSSRAPMTRGCSVADTYCLLRRCFVVFALHHFKFDVHLFDTLRVVGTPCMSSLSACLGSISMRNHAVKHYVADAKTYSKHWPAGPSTESTCSYVLM